VFARTEALLGIAARGTTSPRARISPEHPRMPLNVVEQRRRWR